MFKKITLFLLCLFLVGCTPSTSIEKNLGMLEAKTELFHDFGAMDIQGGKVNHTFSLLNKSEQALSLVDLKTSCMCTQAEIIDQNGVKVSNVKGFQVLAGQEFDVLVTYDPLAHGPDAVGEVNRSIMLTTSSIENGRIAVKDENSGYSFTQMNIKGEVMYSQDFQALN